MNDLKEISSTLLHLKNNLDVMEKEFNSIKKRLENLENSLGENDNIAPTVDIEE